MGTCLVLLKTARSLVWLKPSENRRTGERLRGVGDQIRQVSEPRTLDVLFLHEMSKDRKTEQRSEMTGFVSAESLWLLRGEVSTGVNGGWRSVRRLLRSPGEY